ncbi:DNA mismatch repair protein Msh6 [Nephila pilipes]|uniref:DNA mismatch repair protein n=1 Tax=Nephila pilipes TaxID=299642 RepID=A0A8X6IDW7_NEPPI|nr:DNA mismatch repair protein Msh6 [Nephila pilipes]
MSKPKTILDFFSKSPVTASDNAKLSKLRTSKVSYSKTRTSTSSDPISTGDTPLKKNTSPVVKSPVYKTSLKSNVPLNKSPLKKTPVKSETGTSPSICYSPLAKSVKETPTMSKRLRCNDKSSTSKVNSPVTKTPVRKISATSVDVTEKSSVSQVLSDGSFSTQREKRRRNFKSSYNFGGEESEDEMEKSSLKNKKRMRIVEPEDDSDEYIPDNLSASDESLHENPVMEVGNGASSEYHTSSSDNMSETSSHRKEKKRMKKKCTPSFEIFSNPKALPKKGRLNISASVNSPKMSASRSDSNSCTPRSKQVSCSNTFDENKESDDNVKEFLHQKLRWLEDDSIQDGHGTMKDEPGFDPGSVSVPSEFYKDLTPAMAQWWRIKEDNFDTILFFKVGKFYELFHMDAVIGVKELGLVYMKGEYAHCGFPEIAFGRYSECLIEKGYRIARIEQTETPKMMEERCRKDRNCTKYNRVVEREICQIISKGTKTYTYQDENITSGNSFLFVICEKLIENDQSASEYGVCFIDTSIGKFTIGQFADDRHGSRLLTLIALYPPTEVLYERNSVTKKTLQILSHHLSETTIMKQSFSEFLPPYRVLRYLQQTEIFHKENAYPEVVELPETFLKFLEPGNIEAPKKEYELAIRAFSGCVWHLQKCCIDEALLSMKLFDEYIPIDQIQSEFCKSSKDFKKHMVLDGITLENLDIVPLAPSDNAEGTLFGTIDYCSTSFGKRLFRNWLCSPLCNPDLIIDRSNAVDDLVQIPEVVESAVAILKKLPDIERFLSKIHTYGFNRSKFHPESKAIYYHIDTYNKRKIIEFLSTLESFKQTSEIVSLFRPHTKNFKSGLLKQCVNSKEQWGHFPDMSRALKYFDDSFDHDVAKERGNIIPSEGVDKEYDKASKDVIEIIQKLDAFLERQKQVLNCKVSFISCGKNRYLLEVPENKKVPNEFQFQGGRKGFKRYYTKETKDLLALLISAEECRTNALSNITRHMFALFDEDYQMWKTAVHCISTLDALINLTLYYKLSGAPMCKPEFSLPSEEVEPHLEIINGRHPTFLKYFTGDNYIPNSVCIGPKQDNDKESINCGGKLVLVTGPNMGGKSTLMRQAGALVIMAHIGSYVPAESMRLTPVDRIFTRVGASDRISKGESTFFVEASETSSILNHATADSFVLIDELGRGTATFDGTAIASATLDYLATKIRCRTLFSTHYHSLCDDYSDHPDVGLGHMAYIVEKDSNCPLLDKITFLYKFVDGSCPKSHGFNVAKLAGIPTDIVEEGFLKAEQMEISARISILLRRLLYVKTPSDILKEMQEKYNFFKKP